MAQPQPEYAAPPSPATEPEPMRPAWSLPHRIFFRLAFCYLVLYMAPEGGRVSAAGAIPGTGKLLEFYQRVWHAVVPWIAIHIFHLSGPRTTYFRTGSGDTTLAYIENLCYVVLAVLGMLAWSVLDRKRPDYRTIEGWLRIAVRYTLALTLFAYGFAKVFPLQFRFPGFAQLIEPYGEFSPMGVLWNFMGTSTAYTIFTGAVEITGGLLLLFRRTTSLGAVTSAAALLNIVMLNFCYDVPVKLYSVNLFLMAVFLLTPDLRRLLNVLVLNRAAAPADLAVPRFGSGWTRWAAAGVKVLFIGSTLYFQIHGGWTAYKQVRNASHPPFYGLYDVESFARQGREAPPLPTASTRWRRVAVQFPNFITVRAMDDSPHGFSAKYDSGNILTLTQAGKTSTFTYSWPDPDHIHLEGTLDAEPVSIQLHKVDTSKFMLISRGFHWISEQPFNR